MVRRSALLLLALASWLLFAGLSSATAAGSPVYAGTYSGTLTITKSFVAGGEGAHTGPVSYAFGNDCSSGGACTVGGIQKTVQGGSAAPVSMKPGAGGFSYSGTRNVKCTDNDTGALRVANGFTYTFRITLVPTATETHGGQTYVTALGGTYKGKLAVTAAGRARNCLVRATQTPSASESGTYQLTLAALPAPKSQSVDTPLAAPGVSGAAGPTAPVSGIGLTDRQRASRDAVDAGTRSSVPGSLITPSEAAASVSAQLTKDLLLAAVLGLLVVFPAQLFNATYDVNRSRIERRLHLSRRRQRLPDAVSGRFRRVLVFGLCTVVGVVLGGFLDPRYGAHRASYALSLGILLSVLATLVVAVVVGQVYRSSARTTTSWRLESVPSALLVAVGCVVVSRLTGFQPGYLYGVIAGAIFAAVLSTGQEGHAELVTTVAVFAVAIASWFGFAALSSAANGADPTFATLTGDAFLSSLFIGGMEGLFFSLIPMAVLPGGRIKAWSWWAWLPAFAVVALVFVHVLLTPSSGYLGRSTVASMVLTVAMLVLFGLGSVAFWGYFKARPTRPATSGGAA